MAVNDQVRFYASELWSLVLINNVISSQQMSTDDKNTTNYQDYNFDQLFSNLLNLNKTVLNNVTITYSSFQ